MVCSPAYHTIKTFDPLLLSLTVSNRLEILIYFDAIFHLLSTQQICETPDVGTVFENTVL